MLFPSLFFLESEGLLAPGLTIVGTARSDMTDEAFVAKVAESVRGRAGAYFSDAAWERFRARLRYAVVDAQVPASFKTLKGVIGGAGETVFYLSTSPSLFGPICEALKAAKLINGASRVVVEKPIGHDLASCQAINDTLAASFSEDRIFRVDHYLGKEAVQNLLSLRFANTLFEPLWNKANIEHIQITVAETVGVEGRWDYYNNYGALRDMVQNHLLQLLCLVMMEPPANLDPDSVRSEKVKVLQALRPLVGRDVEKHAVRAQYASGVAEGGSVPGYLDEGADGQATAGAQVRDRDPVSRRASLDLPRLGPDGQSADHPPAAGGGNLALDHEQNAQPQPRRHGAEAAVAESEPVQRVPRAAAPAHRL
jgi:glucose-6-phosphate 1-dehydrogenase